jgi:hypothetical protein
VCHPQRYKYRAIRHSSRRSHRRGADDTDPFLTDGWPRPAARCPLLSMRKTSAYSAFSRRSAIRRMSAGGLECSLRNVCNRLRNSASRLASWYASARSCSKRVASS